VRHHDARTINPREIFSRLIVNLLRVSLGKRPKTGLSSRGKSMNLSTLRSVGLALVLGLSSTAFARRSGVDLAALSNINGPFPSLQISKLITMPDQAGHHDWIDAIKGARRSIHMMMYHLTDKDVVDALASKSGIEVKIIVDRSATKGGYSHALQPLNDAGIQIRPASQAFALMHAKAMVIDDEVAFVTAINMTNTAQTTRDFGVVTSDQSVIREMDSVFETDWASAQTNAGDTPELSQANLAWSPVNSQDKLLKLIDSATGTLVLQAESLSLPEVIEGLNRASGRGVKVQVIAPMCDSGMPLFDYPALAQLKAHGAEVHVMPYPATAEHPYMHSKMIVADGVNVYIGSINYSANSIQKSRELGILFNDPNIGQQLTQTFNQDWERSVEAEDNPSASICHVSTSRTSEN
jgi:phosphatidylserine/phosphatidylglycerophosphate/cardiolipin synthase-like enzyme